MNITPELIKERIKKKYKTAKDFSEISGISYSTINKILADPKRLEKLSASAALKFFQLLDMDINTSGLSGLENPDSYASVLTPDEKEMVRVYRCLPNDSKKFLMQTGKRLDKLIEGNKEALIIPMRPLEKKEEWEELAYLPQAAGMGLGSHAEEYPIQETIRCKASQIPEGTDFVILAEGDSMEPKFHDGDKLFVKKTDWLDPGDIGLVYFEGDEMVKIMGNGCLESINEKYPPIDISYDPDSFFIHGKILGKMK